MKPEYDPFDEALHRALQRQERRIQQRLLQPNPLIKFLPPPTRRQRWAARWRRWTRRAS